ncbi:MAG TPA: MFS transporter [bacterium]|nr:MFS transporter [bacterium]
MTNDGNAGTGERGNARAPAAVDPETISGPAIPRSRVPGSLWRHPDFLKLWSAQTISVFGSQFTNLAIPLIAALTLRATPAQMGVLTAVETAPFLLIGLLAGVWVDRLPGRPILVAGDIGRGIVLLTIPLAALAGRLTMAQLYAVGFLVGVLTVFFDVAYQAFLPSLVERTQLIEGNSKLEVSRSAAQVTGPGIAGVLIQALSAPVVIVLDAVSFFVSGFLIGMIRRREEPPARTGRGAMLAEAREGLAVVFGNPLLRSIAGTTGTSNFFAAALFSILILYATRTLGLMAASIGLVFTIGSLGALVGALTGGRLGRALGVGPAIIGSIFVAGLGFVIVVAATPQTAVLLLAAGGVLGSFGGVVYNINQVSLRQAITPQRLQGRMNATMRFIVWGTMPLGGLAGGYLGEVLGLRPAIAVTAAGGLLAFLWVLFSPVRTLRAIPEPVE